MARRASPHEALAERLRAARARSGLSQAQVAEALAIPRSAVSLIESGERSISGLELAAFADVVGEPVESLLRGAGPGDARARGDRRILAYFRSEGNGPVALAPWLEDAAERWETYAWLEQQVFGHQRYDLPTYPVPAGRAYEQGERLANQERRRLGLGHAAIRSVIELLEGEGVKVIVLPFAEDAAVSGCYFFAEDLGPCVLINERERPSRRRFTAAHEYAHFLVDRGQVEGEVCSHDRRREPFEMRANAFAAAFLLPAAGIDEALRVDLGREPGQVAPEDAVQLMYRFGVSYEAVTWRLFNLGWITAAQRESLAVIQPMALAASLGYEGIEPGETEPKPGRYRALALDAWRSGKVEADKAAELLGMSVKAVLETFAAGTHVPPRSRRRARADPDWL